MSRIKLIRVAALILFLLAFFIGPSPGKVQSWAEDWAKNTDSRTEASQNVSFIQLANDHLSVKVQDMSLKELLEEIANQSDLTLEVKTSLKERVTLELHEIPLEEGLRRILRHHNFALLGYAKKTSEKTQLVVLRPRKLWIFSKGIGKYPEQIVGKREEGVSQPVVIAKPEWQDAMVSKDPEERKEAYGAIVEALWDEDLEVLEEVEESLREFEKAMTEH